MNIKELKQIVRQIVKEEVRPLILEEINKSMMKLLSDVISNNGVSNKILNGSSVDAIPQPKKEKKFYNKNPILNDILNETVNDLPPDTDNIEYNELVRPTPRPTQPAPSALRPGQKITIDSLKGVISEGVESNNNPGAMTSVLDISENDLPAASVLKQDFRAIMKATDRIKNGGGAMSGRVAMMGIPRSSDFEAV